MIDANGIDNACFDQRQGVTGYDVADVDALLRLAAFTLVYPADPHALTADEVRRWRLHEAPGGYDMSQVDDLLDQIIVTLDGKGDDRESANHLRGCG